MPGDANPAERQADVAGRGRQVMPFDLDATTYRSSPTASGLVETVVADDPDDDENIALIRDHRNHEAERFAAADYRDPAVSTVTTCLVCPSCRPALPVSTSPTRTKQRVAASPFHHRRSHARRGAARMGVRPDHGSRHTRRRRSCDSARRGAAGRASSLIRAARLRLVGQRARSSGAGPARLLTHQPVSHNLRVVRTVVPGDPWAALADPTRRGRPRPGGRAPPVGRADRPDPCRSAVRRCPSTCAS